MLELARPGFLLAGALAGLATVALHLIVRQPPRRVALPTLRFLRPDPRLTVRLHRRPTDLLLLFLRCTWLLLLGLALAAPSWTPRRGGTVEVVLVDRGAGMAAGWGAAVDSVQQLVGGGESAAGGFVELVLFDTAATRIPASALSPTFLDSLAAAGPGEATVDYAVALRALAEVARARADADSFRVTLVTRPRWEGWGAGLAQLRTAAWPGGIRVVAIEGTGQGEAWGEGWVAGRVAGREAREGALTNAAADARAAAAVAEVFRGAGGAGGIWESRVVGGDGGAEGAEIAGGAGGAGGAGAEVGVGAGAVPGEWVGVPYVETALHALGWEVRGGGGAEVVVVPAPLQLSSGEQIELLELVRAGAMVIVSGDLPAGPLRAALPWEWPVPATSTDAGIPTGPGAVSPTASGAASFTAPDTAIPTAAGATAPAAPGAISPTAPGALVLDSGPVISGAAYRLPGRPRPGSRLLAVWEDGQPAAVAAGVSARKGTRESAGGSAREGAGEGAQEGAQEEMREGTGCLVFLATELEAGELPLMPTFPDLLEHLLRGCALESATRASPARDDRPLDLGGRRLLAGPDSLAVVSSAVVRAALGAASPRPLGGWVLLGALGIALLETWFAYRRRGA